VYKTVTPDIAADATGGFINMVTKSAFDRENESLLTYNMSFGVAHTAVSAEKESGTWGHGSHYNIRPNLEANYARRFSDKVGFNINYRLSEIYHDSPRSTLAWLYTGPGVSVQDPTLLSYIQNNEQKLTHRESVASKVDWKISDRTQLTLSGQWNWYDLLFTQRALAFTFVGANAVPTTNAPGANTSNSGTGRAIQNQFLQRAKYGTTLHFNSTLTHDFENDSKAWLVGYLSKANSKYRDATKGFLANVNANYSGTVPDFSMSRVVDNPKKPDFIFPAGTSFDTVRSLANYTLSPNGTDNFRSRPDTAFDRKTGVNGHYSLPLGMLPVPVTIQVGSAFDNAQRDIRRVNIRAAGVPTFSGADLQAYREATLFDYGYGFGSGETFDSYKLYDQFKNNLTVVNNDFIRRFDEDNLSLYFRADVKLLPDLLLIGGVRWEKREIYASGRNQAIARNLPAVADLSYDNYYPSLTIKYTPKFDQRLVLRAGISRTVGHPDYSELLPDFTGPTLAGANDGSITVPDKGLKPYFVNNYDIVAEYYPNRAGAASISLFRKDVKGFIVSQALPANSPEADAIIKDYNLDPNDYAGASKRINGKNSTLNGIELLYNQALSFLPKPFDGLNVQFNYTKIHIDADDLDTQYAQELAAVTESMNFVLGYRIGKFNFTLTNNWTGDVLISIPAAQTTTIAGTAYTNRVLQYKTPEQKTSIKVEYALHRNARVYAEVRNLFYERHEYVQGYNPADRGVKLPGQYYVYGDPFFVLGVKGSF
jgi:TonB-dependent receptor